ncbi:hypothetical protein [Candidatus Poriferisodalis sp.]|uniref:hypothetical protein n=1 Tax=Candidatus Poriferisodalis sp. TaxID=3101277 RepID=UPI003B52B584
MSSHGGFSTREVLRPEGAEVRSIKAVCNTDDGLGVISASTMDKEIGARPPKAMTVKEGLPAQTIELGGCAFDALGGHIT